MPGKGPLDDAARARMARAVRAAHSLGTTYSREALGVKLSLRRAAVPMQDAFAGTFAAGWNDAIERSFPKVERMARGTGGAAYVRGFNACLASLRAAK